MNLLNEIGLFIACVVLAGCATLTPKNDTRETGSAALCQTEFVAIFVDFPTARVNHCQINSQISFNLVIDPENKPINSSAWYGFKIVPNHAGMVHINLSYSHAKHRYPPKISTDGIRWELLEKSKVDVISNNEVRLNIAVEKAAIYISAQEIFSVTDHNNWIKKIENNPSITKSIIGKSVLGRPIYKLETGADLNQNKPYVFIVGRQHPPEVTGAMALSAFVETMLGRSELAKKFRKKYNFIIIPNMNPDGVTHGNWRHNMNGIDLNRDWGPFTQPETQAIENELRRFKNGGDGLVLFLDFHSTRRNLLYTQTDKEPTSPANFARDWLKAVDDRLDDNRLDDDIYKFTREQSPNSGKPTSKNYMYARYGIPAITYEVGDNTDRKALAQAAEIFAQEMMKNLMGWKQKQ